MPVIDLEAEIPVIDLEVAVGLFPVAIFLAAVELEDALFCAPAVEAAFAMGADLVDDEAFDTVVAGDCFLSVLVTEMVLGRLFKRLLYEADAAA